MLGAMSGSDQTPTPPDATPGLELDLLLLAMLGGVAAMLAMLLAFGGRWMGYYTVHLWLPMWLLACAVFGGARLADRPAWLRKGLRVTRGQFVEYGGGFYGATALIAFGWLEWQRFQDLLPALGWPPSAQQVVRQLVDFSIDSVMNGLWAFVWPAFHAKAFELHDFWAALGLGAGVYAAAEALMQRLPAPSRA